MLEAILLAIISAGDPISIPATFIRIIDGDTFEMRAHLPFDVHIDLTVRLQGVDCPEMRGLQARQGAKAKEFAATWAAAYPNVIIYDTGAVSFDRRVSFVCPEGGGQCLTEALIGAGHVKVTQKSRKK